MCPGNGTIQCALGMRPANVPWEWDYPMCPGKLDNQMCPRKELVNVPREWDYSMCHVNGTSQCALGMGLCNVH